VSGHLRLAPLWVALSVVPGCVELPELKPIATPDTGDATVDATLDAADVAIDAQWVQIDASPDAGDASDADDAVDVEVAGPQTTIVQLAATMNANLALLSDGTVAGWGTPVNADFGAGISGLAYAPMMLEIGPFERLAAGTHHACGLDAFGDVHCWGTNAYGQADPEDPAPVIDEPRIVGQADALFANWTTTCTVKRGGEDDGILCWGRSLTYASEGPSADFVALDDVHEVAIAIHAACAVSGEDVPNQGGQVHCWGSGAHGVIGDPLQFKQETIAPSLVQDLPPVVTIGAGEFHMCAVSVAGKLFCWGSNGDAQVAANINPSFPYRLYPVELASPTTQPFLTVLGNWRSTCALDASGLVFCHGNNVPKLVPDVGLTDIDTPTLVTGLPPMKHLEMGRTHVCAADDQTVWCWSNNERGQSAFGDDTDPVVSPQSSALETWQ